VPAITIKNSPETFAHHSYSFGHLVLSYSSHSIMESGVGDMQKVAMLL
jgi:hypothetical protein